ncbi:hypothetical protein LIER_15670 [Lithospermum erythrorhizon]|uniref:Homeobox protein knotted-1-like 1 n=1 Tax=Lithospermum erythrorhizon TaxID=34254 RepID=A0AAV3Q6Z4_LITER
MDELYTLHSSISYSYNDKNLNNNNDDNNNIITGLMGHDLISSDHQQHGSTQEAVGTTEVIITGPVEEEEHMSDVIKSRIINHPLYPNLVSAYIQCRKVGATPDMVSFLEEIGSKESSFTTCDRIAEIGVDPQLDDFMESYCKVLHRLREDISKPFHEASSFFNHMESQLSSLCRQNLSPIATTPHGLLPFIFTVIIALIFIITFSSSLFKYSFDLKIIIF